MTVFESLLVLLGLAIVLLQMSKRFDIPYPAVLAVTGCIAGASSWTPQLSIDPHLALAIFITPALFDAAYDTTRRQLSRNWLPLTALAVFAVIVTTVVVAVIGWSWAGLPAAAAITLGAIVAPPDAAAVSAILGHSKIPKNTILILQGESLLNDAVALLIFGVASSLAMTSPGTTSNLQAAALPVLIAIPGGIILAWIWTRLFLVLAPFVAQALSSTILEFVMTFGIWVLAERLRVSPILAVVFFAMGIAKVLPERQSARDRIHSYSVWDATVFLLNVLAFLLMGLQARKILEKINTGDLTQALTFAGVILATVIIIRIVWIMTFNAIEGHFHERLKRISKAPSYSLKVSFLVSWCGVRGLITIATALALPSDFPSRNLIILTAFSVVLGTLVLQGLTLSPLLRWLKIRPKKDEKREIAEARIAMIDEGIKTLSKHTGRIAEIVKSEFEFEKELALKSPETHVFTKFNKLRLLAISSQRKLLIEWRNDGRIDDVVYHELEETLDWAELAAAPPEETQLSSH